MLRGFPCFAALLAGAAWMSAQSPITTNADPTRYFAAHGERGFIAGNRSEGVEAYIYPFQLFRGLHVSFRTAASRQPLDGSLLLRTNMYAPGFIERKYLHDSLSITERLSMAPHIAGGEIEYTVDGGEPVTIELSFVPVLDLMWPGGAGGQEIHWSQELKAYVFDEPTHRFAGIIGSPDTSAHSPVENSNQPTDSETRLRIDLAPNRRAKLFFAASPHGLSEARAIYQQLIDGPDAVTQGIEDEKQRAGHATEIVTPSEQVNQALAWSEVALKQAWACNPALGCGLVGGYSPSRGIARRPQYAWFFAGDALVSLPALLQAGYFEMVKAELLFLLRYQDKQTGMMWHEYSQSAAYLKWTTDYPYAFAHADITPAFLSGVAQYLQATGDLGFVRDHWTDLELAYRYVEGLLDKSDGMPRVPAGKAAHDEQLHPPQELELATDCFEAAKSYALLAESSGHTDQQKQALRVGERIQKGFLARFWNEGERSWRSGIGSDGEATPAKRLPSAASLEMFSPEQRDIVLSELDSPAFQTPWGIRSMAVNSAAFHPNAYAAGSVWAKSTSEAALMLWRNGRAGSAWKTWSKLLPWLTADSAGHIHEVMSGTEFRPQVESVAEQTWSSALMFSSFAEGVLGLRYGGSGDEVTLAPKLPDDWPELQVKRLRAGQASLNLIVRQNQRRLSIMVESKNAPMQVDVLTKEVFGPRIETVELNGTRCTKSEVCSVRVRP